MKRPLPIPLYVLVLALTLAVRGNAQGADSTAAGTLNAWFHFIEQDQFDSLPQLLARDFRFESDGKSWNGPAFVAMIRGLGIVHPRIELSDVTSRPVPQGMLVRYRRRETSVSKGVSRTVDEAGQLMMVREHGHWRIRRWITD